MNIYHYDTSVERVSISQSEMPTKATVQINHLILEKLQSQLEGCCNSRGLIKKGSIQILQRSLGLIHPGNFKGDYHFQVKISYQVCNPREGMVIKCQAYNNRGTLSGGSCLNKMGIIAGIGPDLSQSPIMIMIARFQHQNLERFHQIQVGDHIVVEIVAARTSLGDSRITVMGLLKTDQELDDHQGGHQEEVDFEGGGDVGVGSGEGGDSIMDIQRQEKLYNTINHAITNEVDLDSLVTDLPVKPMIESLQQSYTPTTWNELSLDEKNHLIVQTQSEIESR